MRMIFRLFFEPTQCSEGLLVLAAIELQLGLSQQYGISRFRSFLVGQPQPLIATFIPALQVCRTCGLQVVEQRGVARACGSTEHLLAACEISFGDGNHPLGQFLPGAGGPVTACNLAEPTGSDNNLAYQPYGKHKGDGQAGEHRHGHFDDIAAEVDDDVARIGKQKMRGKRTDKKGNNDDDAKFHCAFSLNMRNCLSKRRDSEMSGASVVKT